MQPYGKEWEEHTMWSQVGMGVDPGTISGALGNLLNLFPDGIITTML